jgi:transcriptional regulator with XRE-family HTH domain
MDFYALQTELLVAIRRGISQAHLSKKLGFRSNRVHNWETGKSSVSWSEFCHLCEAQRIPLDLACQSKAHFEGSAKETQMLVRHLFGKNTSAQLAQRLGVSRSMVSRWQTGKVEPSLTQMLQFMEVNLYSLPEFLAALVPVEKLPSVKTVLERERKEKQLHRENPWIAALLLYIRTVEYNRLPKHVEGFLAKKLGIPVEVERTVVKALLELGVLEWEGKILAPARRTIDTNIDPASNLKIREYWLNRSLATVRKGVPLGERNRLGYMLFNTTPETYEKVRQLYFAFFQDLHNVVLESKGASDQVHLLQMHILNVDDLE